MLLLLIFTVLASVPIEAQSALRQGDCTRFFTHQSKPTSPQMALASARCGDFGPLEGTPISDTSKDMQRWHRLALAKEKIAKAPDEVLTLLKGQAYPGQAQEEAVLLRGRAMVKLGKSLDARPALRTILEGRHGAEARYWLSQGAEDRGDINAAIATYQAIWTRFPTSPFSEKAASRLKALGKALPAIDTTENQNLTLARARTLTKKYRAKEAAPLFELLFKAGALKGDRALEEYAKTLFRARDYAKALSIWGELDPMGSQRISSDALFHYALTTSRTGDYDRAAEIYQEVSKRFPSIKRGDFASYKIGYLAYDKGNHKKAIKEFKAHLQRRPQSQYAEESRWFIGWSHYSLGQLEQAQTAMRRFVEMHPKSRLVPGALYWSARIDGLSQSPSGKALEEKGLRNIVKRYPFSGYAYFASKRLGIPSTSPPQAQAALPKVIPGTSLHEALLLVEAGWMEWAKDFLSDYRKNTPNLSDKERILAAQLQFAAGDYRGAKRVLGRMCKKTAQSSEHTLRDICLARPEANIVTETANKSGLDPLLPYAIMTAESNLDPSVTSPAGARGLMQLMPFLGEELHGILLGSSTYDGERLYIPGYNAWFGTTELGRLHQRFSPKTEDALPMTIAGYNAGFEAVERWLEAQKKLPPHLQGTDAFMENIGYTETRKYVRKVLGYTMKYRATYTD